MMPVWLSLVDVLFLIVILMFAWGGYQKGFTAQLPHILSYVIVSIYLFLIYPPLFRYLGSKFRNADDAYFVTALLCLAVIITVSSYALLSRAMAGFLKKEFSEQADQFNGFMLGGLRGAITALLVMIVMVIMGRPEVYDNMRERSVVGQMVCYKLVPRIQPNMTRAVMREKLQRMRYILMDRDEAPVY